MRVIFAVFILTFYSCNKLDEKSKMYKEFENEEKVIYNNNKKIINQFIEIKYDSIHHKRFRFNVLIDDFKNKNLDKNEIEYGHLIDQEFIEKHISVKNNYKKFAYKFKTRYNNNIFILNFEGIGDHCFAENILTYDIRKNEIIDKIIFSDVNYKSNFYFKFMNDTIKIYKYDFSLENSDALINQFTIDEKGKIIYHSI
jgi:hypothetical protein